MSNTLSSNTSILKRDFSGKLYHKIVGNWIIRKGFATYFTMINSAYLLSYLSISSEYKPFKDALNVKVCDFTCGSGTLLTTTYATLEDLYKLENFENGEIDLDEFHKKVLENNMWGFDALRYAVQIASLNLVFHNPSVPLNHMNFSSIPLGVNENQQVELGSLRFLKSGTLIDYFGSKQIAQREAIIDTVSEKAVNIPSFDLIIMNPPFTRATGRGGKEGGGLFGFIMENTSRRSVLKEYTIARKQITESLLKIGNQYLNKFKGGTFTSIGAAGEGLLFLYLASQYLNNEGRLSFVLPKSMLSGASWFLIRTFFLEKFHVEYVIVSYDNEKGYNFSESTSLSEVLIIARKTTPNNNHKTSFVMLIKKPQSNFECKALSKLIVNKEKVLETEKSLAYKHEIERTKLKEYVDNWGRFIAFPHLKLMEFIEELNGNILFGKKIDITRLNCIADIGIDAHQFHDSFQTTKKQVSSSYPIVYGGNEKNRLKIYTSFNLNAVPLNNNADNLFKRKMSCLLVPDRIRLSTAHVISLLTASKTLSNIFYAVKLNNESQDKYKAICAWINSTFGLLLILSNRQETEGAWIRLKMSHWRLLSILNVEKLDKNTIKRLSNVIDRYGNEIFARIPEQYIEYKKHRLPYDKEILAALGIKVQDDILINLYNSIVESFCQWFKFSKTKEYTKFQ
jgi:hypothetical protein